MIAMDTIVALSSSPGPAARAIVRLSGSSAKTIAGGFVKMRDKPTTSSRGLFHIDAWKFPGTVYFFTAPRSYTGEDLVEFHIPGNLLICERLMANCVEAGARTAEPGEFTARAFFNGKVDLLQAEGIAATIAALNQRQLDVARQLMAGELARRLSPITDLVADTLALVEAAIDFVDEEISFISQTDLSGRLDRAGLMLAELAEQSPRFAPSGAEPVAVLAGRPNAGKSTLLNALAQSERAIVSPVAGTTRDVLSVELAFAHGVIKIIDVAGIAETDEINTIDRQMQSHARRAVESADLLIHISESLDRRPSVELGRTPDLRVRSKIDLGGEISAQELGVSALTGMGMNDLRQALDRLAFGDVGADSALSLNARHLQAITDSQASLHRARGSIRDGYECLALHLREALDHLGQITGTISPDELLGKIFGKFCIGK